MTAAMRSVDVCTEALRGGSPAMLWLPDDGYLLDDPLPKRIVDLSVPAVPGAGGEPYRVDVALLSIAEYRRRYP